MEPFAKERILILKEFLGDSLFEEITKINHNQNSNIEKNSNSLKKRDYNKTKKFIEISIKPKKKINKKYIINIDHKSLQNMNEILNEIPYQSTKMQCQEIFLMGKIDKFKVSPKLTDYISNIENAVIGDLDANLSLSKIHDRIYYNNTDEKRGDSENSYTYNQKYINESKSSLNSVNYDEIISKNYNLSFCESNSFRGNSLAKLLSNQSRTSMICDISDSESLMMSSQNTKFNFYDRKLDEQLCNQKINKSIKSPEVENDNSNYLDLGTVYSKKYITDLESNSESDKSKNYLDYNLGKSSLSLTGDSLSRKSFKRKNSTKSCEK